MRYTPGSRTSPTWLLGNSECHTLIERSTKKRHFAGIRTPRHANMLCIYFRHFGPQQLKTINQSAQPPSPLAICSILLQFRIKTVKLIVATSLSIAPEKLGIRIHLRFAIYHRCNRSFSEYLTRKRNSTRSNHQREGSFTLFGIADDRAQGQRLSIRGDIHNQCIAIHTGLYLLLHIHGWFLTNTVMLYHSGNLATTTGPITKILYPFQCIGQFANNRQICYRRHHGQYILASCILYIIHQWDVLITLASSQTYQSNNRYN